MNRKHGRDLPYSESGSHHEIDYAGLPRDVEEDEEGAQGPAVGSDAGLSLKLTQTLHAKLVNTARDEGVSLDQLVQELLAEGVTLRAWEIIERKSAMRASSHGQQGGRGFGPSQGSGHGGPQAGRHGNHQGGPGRHGGQGGANNARPGRGNTAWMEDKAAFLEYVRNQEKRRR